MHEKVVRIFRKILHWLEGIIATMTLVVLVGMVFQEIYRMFTVSTYFDGIDTYLHTILTLVVGLEFVRMLIDMTPANTIEVLIVAISRQVIISHEDPISNICCVLCIAGLFATRHFLIPKEEVNIEMSDVLEEVEAEAAAAAAAAQQEH